MEARKPRTVNEAAPPDAAAPPAVPGAVLSPDPADPAASGSPAEHGTPAPPAPPPHAAAAATSAPATPPAAGASGTGGASFEAMLEELERIVRELESGEASLDRSLALFQRGIGLVRRCYRHLDAMERTIQWLLEDEDGEPRLVPAPELVRAAEGGETP